MSLQAVAVLIALAATTCAPGVRSESDATVRADDAPPRPDASIVPPSDAPPMVGSGLYLDRCFAPEDCASSLCISDFGGALFCSRSCTSHSQCALEHVCGPDGVCVPEDTGAPCNPATPTSCALDRCIADAADSAACTRDCSSAADCPAGYACTRIGGVDGKVCVDIEKPCASVQECASGVCLPIQGCSAACDVAGDCPQRLPGLVPYVCGAGFGSTTPICLPPEDIIGSDPIGASCQWDTSSGASLCRSAGCDDAAPVTPMCTQSCTAQGGCGPGLGCFPLADGGEFKLVCSRAGGGDLGDGCGTGSECHSGLCDAIGGYCTRLCHDGVCPTGWSCQTIAGSGISLCRQ